MEATQQSKSSNLRGSKSLEEMLIDEVLFELSGSPLAVAQVRAVLVELAGAGSPTYKYVNERLLRLERDLKKSTWVFQKLQDYIGDTAIVGILSRVEMKRRCLILITRLGVGEGRKLIELIENKEPLPANVTPYEKLKAKRQLRAIYAAYTDGPKGAA